MYPKNLLAPDQIRKINIDLAVKATWAKKSLVENIRTANRKERHICLTRDRLCEKCLTSTRRADHKDTLRDLSAHFGKPFGILQKFNYFGHFFLGFVTTSDV